MLEIKPIQSKIEQEAACARCGIIYDAALLAYGAAVDGELVGVCQFKIDEESCDDNGNIGDNPQNSCGNKIVGVIISLNNAININDREALILTARAALNFMDLCGAERVYFSDTSHNDNLPREIGFTVNQKTNKYELNLNGFFESPCQKK